MNLNVKTLRTACSFFVVVSERKQYCTSFVEQVYFCITRMVFSNNVILFQNIMLL